MAAGPPPKPRSPPGHPDLCGQQRLQKKVQMMVREICFLQEELQSLESVHSVSICCKEASEFVGSNPDPIIPLNKKIKKSCGILKWLRAKLCLKSCIRCSCGSPLKIRRPCCVCHHVANLSTCRCKRGWPCSSSPCCKQCCISPVLCCLPDCSCGCLWSCSSCTEACICPRCPTTRTCCTTQCLCF